jgi:hypothetical protein
MPKYDPYDSATLEDGASATDEAKQSGEKERTHEQEAAVRRHLRHQSEQRSRDEQTDGDRFSLITDTGAGLLFRIGLRVIKAANKLMFGDHRSNDVYWGYPIGMAIIVIGALICGLGIVIWAVVVLFRMIYRGITG